ncbi:hypothetical protein [Herbiconiux sp. VKM Ac-2851]|uniref:hypothetical protein n=1 Tax=Herbiconiux sp. VKM Ac-2851 TaxID=2739025 RepID=UPI001C205DE0|nr:hypothetical protein [Herbiconiux sp. VKM Ac-2851]NQX35013.1 hypothetical protein [Herbiconiux sp. VKM Ac-2851]
MCALLDANVLYPSLLRDLLIRVAIEGGLRARWSEQILDETFRSLAANRPDLPAEHFDRTRLLMNSAVSDACDDVLARCFDHDPGMVWKVVGKVARAARLPVLDEHGVIDRMRATGLPATAARLAEFA